MVSRGLVAPRAPRRSSRGAALEAARGASQAGPHARRPPRAASRRPGAADRRLRRRAARSRAASRAPAERGSGPVLGVGAELASAEGVPASLLGALGAAAAVRLQHEENPIACGTDAAGRFFKIAKCAEMVRTYARLHNRSYDLLVVTRPDYLFGAATPLATLVRSAPRTPFLLNCRADFLMASYADGVEKAAGLAFSAAGRAEPAAKVFLVSAGDKPYVAIDGPSGQPCAANNGAMCDRRSSFILRPLARTPSAAWAPSGPARRRPGGAPGTMWLHADARRPPPHDARLTGLMRLGRFSGRAAPLAAAAAARSDAPAYRAAASCGHLRRLGRGTPARRRRWARRPRWPRRWRKRLSGGRRRRRPRRGARARAGTRAGDRPGTATRTGAGVHRLEIAAAGASRTTAAGAGRGSRGRRRPVARSPRNGRRSCPSPRSGATRSGTGRDRSGCWRRLHLQGPGHSAPPRTNASLTFETSEGAFVPPARTRGAGAGRRAAASGPGDHAADGLLRGAVAPAPDAAVRTTAAGRAAARASGRRSSCALKDRGARNWAAAREIVAPRFLRPRPARAPPKGLGPLDDQLDFKRACEAVRHRGQPRLLSFASRARSSSAYRRLLIDPRALARARGAASLPGPLPLLFGAAAPARYAPPLFGPHLRHNPADNS